jgi:thiol-disulfide isomerase/thioredoxin
MRTISRSAVGWFAVLTMLGLTGPAPGAEATGELPRYRLRVGQELRYHASNKFQFEDGAFAETTDWQIWVVAAQPAGGWRLILRSSEAFVRTSRSRLGLNSPRSAAQSLVDFFDSAANTARQKANPPKVQWACIDLFPDGQMVTNESPGHHVDPSALFPRLPANAQQVRDGFDATRTSLDSHVDYKFATATRDATTELWAFESNDTTPSNRIYLMTFHSRYDFDSKQGLVKRVDSENTQGYGFVGKGTGILELTDVVMHDASQTKTLAEESNRYFSARRSYEDLLAKARREPTQVEALLTQAEALLKQMRTTLTLPMLIEQADQDLDRHKGMVSHVTNQARNRAELVDHAAPGWETRDLAGKRHALEDYRGKVVILDFWYRGCGWCIRAMPQIKELAEEFKDAPVAILGMNTDQDENDAQFVVDALKLNYPVLKARDLPEKYHVNAFPTLIIIDPAGKVADIHVGYTSTLREDVARTVRELLRK